MGVQAWACGRVGVSGVGVGGGGMGGARTGVEVGCLAPPTSGRRQGDEPRLVVEEERHVAPAAARGAAWAAEVERLAGGAMPPYPGQSSAGRPSHTPRRERVAPSHPPAGATLVLAATAADREVDAVERDAQHRRARARAHRRRRDAAQRRVRLEGRVDDGATEAAE